MFGLLDLHFILIISAFIISVEGDLSRAPNGAYFCDTRIYSTCGNGFSIRYPFHSGNYGIHSGNYSSIGDCGYPGFKVNCSHGERPIIKISNNPYYILSTDADHRILRVVQKDVDEEECPRPRKNFTLDATSPFSLTSGNNKMTYFYNCSSGYPKDAVQGLPCLDAYYNTTTTTPGLRSFAFRNDDIPNGGGYNWYTNCQHTVRVPVAHILNSSDYKSSLRLGFNLGWHAPTECVNCEDSGGNCFYNKTSGASPLCSCLEEQRMYQGSCPMEEPQFPETTHDAAARQAPLG